MFRHFPLGKKLTSTTRIVYIKLDDRDNAQQIFESINSTGERLTASDLIRNFIMMDKSNEEQTTLYTKYWRRLEEVFDNSKGMEDFSDTTLLQ